MKRYTILFFVFFCLMTMQIFAQSTSCIGTPESRLVIGEQAKILAVGGSNLRSRPSTEAVLLHVVPENEIIPILDGPFCAEGYAWWQIDYDGERGWLAEGFGEFYWLAPHIIHRAQIGSVRIEIQPELVTEITIQRLADPARSQFVLEGFPVTSNQLIPFIVIFDEVPENILTGETVSNARSQEENLETGRRYLELFFTEPIDEATEISLIYHYVAVTEDNRYIDAYFPISAPDLPLPYSAPQSEIESYNQQYFEETQALLETLSPEDFTPPLTDLDGIVRSININAPLEESAVFTFASSGIQLDYHPALATTISEELIPESEIPRHIELTLNDYPAGDALIRIFTTEDIPGSNLSALQQILARQPDNPPQISVLPQSEEALPREDLLYLDFATGSGLRYITSENEAVFYNYQGLSTDGAFYVSVHLPITGDFRPLMLMDSLIASLQIGG